MFCPNCGRQLPAGSRFCSSCGCQIAPAPQPVPAPWYSAQPQREQRQAEPSAKWPPVIGILMALSMLFSLTAQLVYLRYLSYYGVGSNVYYVINICVIVICSVLAIVLFFTPTRRVPAVTSIPRWIGFLYSLLSTFVFAGGGLNVESMIFFFLFTLSPVILYTIGTASKPRTAAIAVIHLVLVALSFIASIFSFEWRMLSGNIYLRSYLLLYIFISALASLLSGVGYSIALFFSRRKYYPDKQ